MSPALRKSLKVAALAAAIGVAVCSTATAVQSPLFHPPPKISHPLHR